MSFAFINNEQDALNSSTKSGTNAAQNGSLSSVLMQQQVADMTQSQQPLQHEVLMMQQQMAILPLQHQTASMTQHNEA